MNSSSDSLNKPIRQEIDDEVTAKQRNESPLDPSIYQEEDEKLRAGSIASFKTSSSLSRSTAVPEKSSIDQSESCSAHNIVLIIAKAAMESLTVGALLMLPSLVVYAATGDPFYNIFKQTRSAPGVTLNSVMEFVRFSFLAAQLYGAWVLINATTRIVPLLIRRSWHLTTSAAIPNSVVVSLAGWKAARVSLNRAAFAIVVLILMDFVVFGQSNLLKSASELTATALSGFSKTSEWVEKALIAISTLSILVLGKRTTMWIITRAFRKEALAPRIIASNFKFRVLTRLFRQVDLTTVDSRRSIAQELRRESLNGVVGMEDEVIEITPDLAGLRLTGEVRARELAQGLWGQVCPIYERNYIVQEDLRRFFTAEDAPEAFAVFDCARTGLVSEQDWVHSIVAIWQERQNLQASIQGSDQTLGVLDGLFHTVILLLWLLVVLGMISQTGLAFLGLTGGILLGFGFLFKDTCKQLFENFIFVLVEHPFDVGDTILLDKSISYQVQKVSLFCTLMKRQSDGLKTYIPNHVLGKKYVSNRDRSDVVVDSMLITLPAKISLNDLGSFQNILHRHLTENYNSFVGVIKIVPLETNEQVVNIRLECHFHEISSKAAAQYDAEQKISRKEALSLKARDLLLELNIIN